MMVQQTKRGKQCVMGKSIQSTCKSYFRVALFAVMTLLMFFMAGCFEENTNANLTITVTGTLSGNPREDIAVQLYLTRDNAEDRVNALSGIYRTNSDGQVTIGAISSGRSYCVRADATLISSYKITQVLRDGDNEFSMTIL